MCGYMNLCMSKLKEKELCTVTVISDCQEISVCFTEDYFNNVIIETGSLKGHCFGKIMQAIFKTSQCHSYYNLYFEG